MRTVEREWTLHVGHPRAADRVRPARRRVTEISRHTSREIAAEIRTLPRAR
jgi:hypothetical protein